MPDLTLTALPADALERILMAVTKEDWLSCALACSSFHHVLRSSRRFFPEAKLRRLHCSEATAQQGEQERALSLALRRLRRVGPTLHAATLAGPACSAEFLAQLPALRSLALLDSCGIELPWAILAALPHLRSLSLDGVHPLSGLRALRTSRTLRQASITVSCAARVGLSDLGQQLAEGLPGLAGTTKLALHLPGYPAQLNQAIASLPRLASLAVSTSQDSKGSGVVEPGAWGALPLTGLLLNFAGDCTHVAPGLSTLTALRRLSLVGAAERSPEDLFAGCFSMELLAVAGTGGLPQVPDHLDAHLPRLRSLEASYGALGCEGFYPRQLCLTQLTSLDCFNAGLETTKDCPHALPDAFSQLTNLRRLSLARNFLEVLPPSLLPLSGLTSLSLWGNCLDRLPPGPYLSSLCYLNLSANRLRQMPREALAGAGPRLRELGMGGNPISELTPEDSRALRGLPGLRVLGFGQLPGTKSVQGTEPQSDGDLELALLWVAAIAVPECQVRLGCTMFTTRFA